MSQRKITIATHNGGFHADDAFSVAVLLIKFGGNAEIIRTRDSAKIKAADFVVDVGMENDGVTRFDHHQHGGAGLRTNGIPYATFGLVWKAFGEELCGNKEVADDIERKLVAPGDATDSGIDVCENKFEGVSEFEISDVISSFKPTWKEKDVSMDESFDHAVDFAIYLLQREIKKATDRAEGRARVREAYKNAEDKRIIVLEDGWPWREVLVAEKEPLFVVLPREDEETWGVVAVPAKLNNFFSRKDLPEEWAGKGGEELAKITGVADAIFCHSKRFMAAVRSREGAIALAQKAVSE